VAIEVATVLGIRGNPGTERKEKVEEGAGIRMRREGEEEGISLSLYILFPQENVSTYPTLELPYSRLTPIRKETERT
jgi:hypothetical protein